MPSRRQHGATPTPRSAVSPPWALAHVTIGQRLASARRSTRVLTLHPLSALLRRHPCATTTTNQPTNQPTYLILSYPLLYPSPRNETSRSIQLASPFRSSVRWRACTYAARSHSRTPFAHTKHTSAQEQRTNAERTSERAGVGGEGGGTHKGRWLGSRVTHESHESARRGGGRRGRRGRREGRAAEMDRERMEGEEGEGRVHARRVSYNWFSRQFDLFERATGSRVFRARGHQRWRRARPTSRPTPSTRYTPPPLLSTLLFSPPPSYFSFSAAQDLWTSTTILFRSTRPFFW